MTAERLVALYEVLRAASEQLDPQAVARVAVETLVRFGRWPNVAICLPSEDGQNWIARAAAGELAIAVGLTLPLQQGVIGRVFRTGQTQHVPDVAADPDYVAAKAVFRSELAVPLRRGERVLGVLNIESDSPAAFSPEDVSLAESLADTVALALDNARLHAAAQKELAERKRAEETLARLAERQMALYGVLRAAVTQFDPLAVARVAVEALVRFGRWPNVAICLPDEEQQNWIARAAAGELAMAVGLTLPLHQGIIGRAFKTGQTQHVPDVAADPDYVASNTVIHSELAVPLRHGERVLGVLNIESGGLAAFSPEDELLAEAFADSIALALDNAYLYKAIADKHGRLQALIRASRDGVMMIGIDGRILVVNAAALQLLRLPGRPEDWLNRPIAELLRLVRRNAPGVVKAALSEKRRMRGGDEPPGEGEVEVPPRRIHWLNLPVVIGDASMGRLAVGRDVTAEHLVDEMRGNLTRMMVHDLRGPLTAIDASLEALATDAAPLSAFQHEMLDIADQSTRSLLSLVTAILDVSRLESGQVPLERAPAALAELAKEVLHRVAPQAKERKLRLSNEVPLELPLVSVDGGLVGRVLHNLLNNAIKFTPEGGAILVAAEAVPDQNLLKVLVRDSGPGIAPEVQARLFQKFVTGRIAGRGSGLGLAFCRLVVEAHGGRIWVESEPGHGTAIAFTLPVFAQDVS